MIRNLKIIRAALVMLAAVAAVMILMTSCGGKDKNEVCIYCYGDYMDPQVVKIFEKEIDIVSSKQLDFILNKYYINPKIYCGCGKMVDVTIRNLLTHKEHMFRIIEFNEIVPTDEFTINSLVIKSALL